MEFKAKDRRLEGDTVLRQCQLAELYLLDVFAEICEKHHLTYFIDAGTALGAARHGGFIPWDDDIDVGMPIKDYKKFLKIASKELPDNLMVTPNKTYGGMEAFAKLRDRSSFFCEKLTVADQPCGFYIDIFPYEEVPKIPIKIGCSLAYWCHTAWVSARIHRTLCHRTVSGVFLSGVKASVWVIICQVLKLLHKALLCFMPHRWRYSPQVPVYRYHQGFEYETLFPPKPIAFEGKEYMGPNNMEQYLTDFYGNWRELPPEDQRHWHASIICPTQAPNAPWARKYGCGK